MESYHGIQMNVKGKEVKVKLPLVLDFDFPCNAWYCQYMINYITFVCPYVNMI